MPLLLHDLIVGIELPLNDLHTRQLKFLFIYFHIDPTEA